MVKNNPKIALIISILMSSLLVSSGFYIISVSGWVDIEDPPGVLGNWRWDFNVSELLIFNVTTTVNISGSVVDTYSELEIFNISSIERQIINWNGKDYNFSCVNLTSVYYDIVYGELVPNDFSEMAIGFNHTATPSLNETLILGNPEGYFEYLWFIPKNDTNLNFEWANSTTLDFYYNIDLDTGSYNAATKSIKFSDSKSDDYYNATYYDNGTISRIYKYEKHEELEFERIIERVWSYAPPINETLIDDLEWSVNPGDILYFGYGVKTEPMELNLEYKIDIVGFKNKVLAVPPTFEPTTYQLVLANISIWYNNTESYTLMMATNETVGFANELEKVVVGDAITYYTGNMPIIFPLGTNGTDFNNTFGLYTYYPWWDQVTIGENIFHLWNSTSDNIINITLTSDKVTKSVFQKRPGVISSLFRKNETILTIGSHSLNLDPVGKFNLTVEFTSNADIALYWATLPFTPASVEINDGLFYFDLFCNNSAAIQGKVNTTIEGLLNHGNFKLWTFIDYNSTWIEIPSTFDPGTGKLTAQFNHFSYYGVSASPPSNPSISINNGDASTNSTLVTLSLSAVGADEMCFRNGTTGTWTNWETYATSKQLYLAGSINNTEYTICVKFQNVKGETSPVCDSIKYLTIPVNLSIIINNGDASTNSTLVTLSLSAVGADEMCFRNGTTGAWSEWEDYSTTKELYLAGSINNTEYTICVKFRNVEGETSPVCDSIKYLIIGEEEPGPEIIIIVVIISIIGGSAAALIIFYLVRKGRKG